MAFDLMRHSALGYVLPTWVEDASDTSSVSKLGSHQTSTKVFLPFKKVCFWAFADESCNTVKAGSHVILTGGRLLADCAHTYTCKLERCIDAVLLHCTSSIVNLRSAHVQLMSYRHCFCTPSCRMKYDVQRMICRVHNSRQQLCAISLMMCVPSCSFSFNACSVLLSMTPQLGKPPSWSGNNPFQQGYISHNVSLHSVLPCAFNPFRSRSFQI